MKKILLGMVALSTLVFAQVNLASCAGCHAKDFSKKAMGKSTVVSDMNASSISKALLGYKAGTRNKHGMGMIMHAQVAKYSVTDLNATGSIIADLNKTK